MRKTDVTQHSLYSYRTLEERIPAAHPLRTLRAFVDSILANMKSCKVRFEYHQIRRIRHAGHSCPGKTEK